MALAKASGSHEFTPFVVFGASKSGTTWVQRILDHHPQVRCHFQVPIFPLDLRRSGLARPTVVVCNAKESALQGVFADDRQEQRYRWQLALIERMSILRRDYVREVMGDLQDAEERAFLKALHHKILRGITRELLCDTAEKSVFGTKSYTDLDLLFEVFPVAKLIHVVRDGRDVCVSKRFHMLRAKAFYLGDEKSSMLHRLNRHSLTRAVIKRLQKQRGWFGAEWFRGEEEGQPLFHQVVLTKMAGDWDLVVRYILGHQQRHPGQVLMLRYEDLLQNPIAEVTRMLAFLDVERDVPTVERLVEQTSFKEMKRGDASGSFFRKGRSGDWRNYFSVVDIQLFKALTGDLLVQLGYERSHDWGCEQETHEQNSLADA